MKAVYGHALVLVLTVALGFFVSRSSLSRYDLQLTGAVFLIYFIVKHLRVKKSPMGNTIFGSHRLLQSALFGFITTTLVNGTGGLASPLFFLYYFLIFALSLILEPVISLTTTATVVILYVMLDSATLPLKDYLPLISLPFMTPFALFLGQEYQKVLKEKKLIQQLSRKEENTFLFLSLIMRNHLKNVREALDNFMGDHELEIIRKNTRRMEQLIDRFEHDS